MGLLRGVVDPELGSDIVELGMAKGAKVDDAGHVHLDIALTTSGCPLRAQIQKDIRSRLTSLPGVTRVTISWGELTQEERSEAMAKARFNVSKDAPETAVPPTTKVIILTNLHNPSGVYTDPWTLVAIGEMAEAIGAKVLVDEVYLETLTDQDTTPAAARSDVFISISSLTKAFGLAGLRVGWILADPSTIQRVRRVRDVVDGTGAVPSERLAVLAFEQIDRLLARARHILEPHAHMLKRFVETRSELDWAAPAGGPIGFPKLVDRDDAEPFVDYALEHFGGGVVAGRHFGAPAHFRVAVGGRRRAVEEGIEALSKALDAWSRG